MADMTIADATTVHASVGADKVVGVAGGAITAGMVLYQDPADNLMKAADANASATTARVAGVALHTAASGQDIMYVVRDPNFIPGFATLAGVPYYLSATTGGLMADATAAATYTTLMGIGKVADVAGTGTMSLEIVTAGVATAA